MGLKMRKADLVMRILRPHLEASRLPYEVVNGGRHRKVFLDGKLVGTIPYNGGNTQYGIRATKNIVARIRRFARGGI